MDVQLPDLDGIEVLRRIRADARTAFVPVVAVTAQAMDGDRERFLRAGFDGYLPKPVNVSELLGVVRRPQLPRSTTTAFWRARLAAD